MPRGVKSEDGAVRIAPNGYSYTKVAERGWVLTHWLIMEKKLGRQLLANEMVKFIDRDRKNLDSKNLLVIKKKTSSLRSRKAALEYRIEQLQAELDGVNKLLESK